MANKPDILYISHGGGPLPLLGDPAHNELVIQLTSLSKRLPRPSAIIVVSAHWEAPVATVTSGTQPPLIYDYSGFPPESYEIQYPAPGAPGLATQVSQALSQAGLDAVQDAKQGFDHGLFVPLKLLYPEADIPCIQLSLLKSLDPAAHIALGRALQSLEWDNLLVIGSGFSFHNMKAFFEPVTAQSDARNKAFEDWLTDTLINPALSETERSGRLVDWSTAPEARYCHPREEHLLPLHLCYGLAQRPADEHESIRVLDKRAGMFYWRGEH